jgi:ATP-dependent Clp protease ATP-binding subunit ClpA
MPTREMILRDLNRWFRPEFLNRLDRIVTFRPLATETAERIAQREIARVLERAGITRRHLAVDVDPGVLPLLLREGYSQAFGARPLKRTVERLVLLPMARSPSSSNETLCASRSSPRRPPNLASRPPNWTSWSARWPARTAGCCRT